MVLESSQNPPSVEVNISNFNESAEDGATELVTEPIIAIESGEAGSGDGSISSHDGAATSPHNQTDVAVAAIEAERDITVAAIEADTELARIEANGRAERANVSNQESIEECQREIQELKMELAELKTTLLTPPPLVLEATETEPLETAQETSSILPSTAIPEPSIMTELSDAVEAVNQDTEKARRKFIPI